jgi:hypothetical protein
MPHVLDIEKEVALKLDCISTRHILARRVRTAVDRLGIAAGYVVGSGVDIATALVLS